MRRRSSSARAHGVRMEEDYKDEEEVEEVDVGEEEGEGEEKKSGAA